MAEGEGEGEGMVVSFLALGRSFAPITSENAMAGCKVVGMATEEKEEGRVAATVVVAFMAATVVDALMAAAAVVVAAATPPTLPSAGDMGLARVALGSTQDA